ncbi:MAG: site-specific integrase [Bacteroidales bacterium]|nr:site-specific integrase [Bacteroidales bacterium]
MGRKKKQLKIKEPVRIRERKLKGGSTSLYLDIYVNGVRKYEALGLYLVPSSQPDAKAINERTRSVAEKIKSDRILALQQRGIKEWDKIKKSKMALIDWLKQYEQDSFGFKQSTLKGRQDLRKKIEEYLDSKGLSHIAMSEVDPDFCRGFLKFLDTAKNSVCTKQKDRIISKGCAHHHQAVFVGALNRAVREGIIQQNPFKRLDRREKFHPSPEEREFLTIDELRTLIAVPCSNDQVKKAFIFSCFTGLRLSDVRSLTWSKIHKLPDGETMYVHTLMQKTQKPVNVPLSGMALQYLPQRGNPEDPVFQLPVSDATINYHVKRWVKAGGISKTISFHCSRHTFATMMLTLGADLYTTSKLLGHSNVTTTQIYSKIIDKKKVETVSLVDDLFTENPDSNKGKEIANED